MIQKGVYIIFAWCAKVGASDFQFRCLFVSSSSFLLFVSEAIYFILAWIHHHTAQPMSLPCKLEEEIRKSQKEEEEEK